VNDVRKNLPSGVNDVDMKDSGKRWCMLHCYGGPFEQRSVEYAMMAWGVKRRWLVNPTSLAGDRVPEITTDGGPEYMMLFGDGKWRYGSFGGLNGPPCASCRWEGYEAPNGEAAYRMMILERKIRHREAKEQEVAALATEIAELKELLSRSMTQPERSDDTWKK
jgi:hypothetical protein